MKLDRPSEGTNEVNRIIGILYLEGSGCKPYGLIQHIATIQRISELIHEDEQHGSSSIYEVCRDLRSNGSVFASKDNMEMNHFMSCYNRITAFKKALHDLRWTRNASRNHRKNVMDEAAEVVEA
jgi:hypothetical protein